MRPKCGDFEDDIETDCDEKDRVYRSVEECGAGSKYDDFEDAAEKDCDEKDREIGGVEECFGAHPTSPSALQCTVCLRTFRWRDSAVVFTHLRTPLGRPRERPGDSRIGRARGVHSADFTWLSTTGGAPLAAATGYYRTTATHTRRAQQGCSGGAQCAYAQTDRLGRPVHTVL